MVRQEARKLLLGSRGRLRPLVRAVTERLNDLARVARRRGCRSWGASVGGEALARGGGLPSIAEHDGRENEDEAVGRRGGHPHPQDDNGIGNDGGMQEQFGSGALIFGGEGHRRAEKMLRERGL